MGAARALRPPIVAHCLTCGAGLQAPLSVSARCLLCGGELARDLTAWAFAGQLADVASPLGLERQHYLAFRSLVYRAVVRLRAIPGDQ